MYGMLVSVKFKDRDYWIDMYADWHTWCLLYTDKDLEYVVDALTGEILLER